MPACLSVCGDCVGCELSAVFAVPDRPVSSRGLHGTVPNFPFKTATTGCENPTVSAGRCKVRRRRVAKQFRGDFEWTGTFMSSQFPDKSANIGAAQILKAPLVVSMATLSVVCLPVLYSYLTNLWTREYYQFFPFAFATVFWFAASRARREPDFSMPQWRTVLHVAAAAGCAALAGLGAFQGSPWPSYCAYMVALALLLDHWQEEATGRRLFYLLLPLLLTVRPPLDGDNIAIQKLQLLTS
ncbi:MAG TPA: hypothetical protein DC058_08510, partial [Planctomycetaceae bacterium]|nr:hypothetical protein [Planctomycetaceae bacterium]